LIIWLLQSLTFEGGFHYIEGEEKSILNVVGEFLAFIFVPLGFGKWQAAVATILGLVAKEEVVGVFGTLSNMFASANPEAAGDLLGAIEGEVSNLDLIGQEFFDGSALAAYSFLIFNLLCAPCFAAMGAIKREMNNVKWTFAAIGYMCVFAYAISLIVFQLGSFFAGKGFTVWTAIAIVVLAFILYMLFRKNKYDENHLGKKE
ncbi:MAG: ferrous iron transporter B, partial [Treponema sp.]|nr:ferrous iron transporter B [Treponema sp.]